MVLDLLNPSLAEATTLNTPLTSILRSPTTPETNTAANGNIRRHTAKIKQIKTAPLLLA
ncbi:uncharacterized protein K452DRAFT_290779 [Aplosporella prunicola CBS 121167]|uniref:Uncharacterized protein n=1 Tax=Aplosporella prunicola CBS 121167 TaxID=1176127 RepID=A0A6A6B4T5_9PEZI|nr:uncharacterized protein K452DRAFT_290779 [Aplosporella prunicola CBS 121167]KAF2138638.1 hypothetical protein K452DRAFT_290779 [Aplosporella prunicola CBS 121167]